MTFDDANRRHRHRTRRGFDHTHSRDDVHSQRSDHTGEGSSNDDEPDAAPPRPKHLSDEAQRRLQAARLWVAANRPYYFKALFSCPVIPAAARARVGIDERWRIYVNSEFVESLTVEQVAVELIHVLNHALRDHATRARSAGVDAATAPAWNLAADCEINDDLLDMSSMPGATKHHRNKPFDPNTGKTRRLDPRADYHHTIDGKPTKIPCRELVMLSCRTGYGNERILLDADFMAPKGSREREGRNEADKSLDMLERLTDENHDLLRGEPGGIKVFIHDMAMDSEAIDRALGNRWLPVVKVPRLADGKYRDGNLGPHTFTSPNGRTETHDVKTLNGSCFVWLPTSRGTEMAVPLRRVHIYWGTEGKRRSIAYCCVALPDDPDVPAGLRGATTTIRLNSTDEEIHNSPHTRRTRSLRPIPEADPDFDIFGGREDIESTFSDFKYRTRGRLCSIHEDRYRFNIVSYMILRLSKTLNAYHKRTATTATQAVPIAA